MPASTAPLATERLSETPDCGLAAAPKDVVDERRLYVAAVDEEFADLKALVRDVLGQMGRGLLLWVGLRDSRA